VGKRIGGNLLGKAERPNPLRGARRVRPFGWKASSGRLPPQFPRRDLIKLLANRARRFVFFRVYDIQWYRGLFVGPDSFDCFFGLFLLSELYIF